MNPAAIAAGAGFLSKNRGDRGASEGSRRLRQRRTATFASSASVDPLVRDDPEKFLTHAAKGLFVSPPEIALGRVVPENEKFRFGDIRADRKSPSA
jgi:hypothetical protein